MTEFLDHMMFVCFAGAAIGLIFLIMGGIFELIDYLSKGKFKESIISFFEESNK